MTFLGGTHRIRLEQEVLVLRDSCVLALVPSPQHVFQAKLAELRVRAALLVGSVRLVFLPCRRHFLEIFFLLNYQLAGVFTL